MRVASITWHVWSPFTPTIAVGNATNLIVGPLYQLIPRHFHSATIQGVYTGDEEAAQEEK